MVYIKEEQPWVDNNSIDTHLDWESDLGFTLLDLPTSEFLSTAQDIEATYGSANGFGGLWGGDQATSSKQQIRNHDCMWSGSCVDQSHPGKLGGCGNNHPAVTVVPEPSANKFSSLTAVAAASLNNNVVVNQKPILAPSNNSTLNINNNLTPKTNFKTQSAQIPAGRSLLINPRNKQPAQRVPTISTADFLRERESTVPLHTRPDTPLSLDEDPPEFKHNIDLATCTIGSNSLKLNGSRHYGYHHPARHDDASSHRIINMLKEQLEDTDNGCMRPYMTSSSGEIGSLTDLLHDLKEIADDDDGEDTDNGSLHRRDELDSDTDSNIDGDSCSRSSKGGGGGLSGGYTHAHHQEMSPSSSSSTSSYEYQGTHVGDHSYTRPKNRYNMNELGVQTPSDSEEEIDVVSIGEKNLPTNPTARAKKELQLRMAHKIARKETQNTVSQQQQHHHNPHHHRRRHSDDEFGTAGVGSVGGHYAHHASGSSSQTSPSKYSPNYLTPASSTGTNTPLPGSSNPRKRPNKDDHRGGSSKNRHHHQHRNKKQRIPGKKSPTSSSSSSGGEASEEQDTLEKRNLHNDMERQRRIGLKNLFEELKRQIPSLREKERAPKVNILREASILCQRLNREQEQLNALRKQQQRLYARVRQLRTSLHSQRRTMD